jgi:hypothetical protein
MSDISLRIEAMKRRALLQYWEDLIADALWDHETGVVSHRRQAEAVLAALIAHGVVECQP